MEILFISTCGYFLFAFSRKEKFIRMLRGKQQQQKKSDRENFEIEALNSLVHKKF